MALNPVTGIEVDGVTQPISYPHLHGRTAVEFTAQTLSDAQRAIARGNIDVYSKAESNDVLNTRMGGLYIIHNPDGSVSISDGETE